MNILIKMALLGALAFGLCFVARAHAATTTITTAAEKMAAETAQKSPSKTADKNNPTETIVLAGGCFWGVEAVFEHTQGVVNAVSGYAGGSAETANYGAVSQGDSGHAEAVQVTYDPRHISLSQVLDIYFTVAHNPTQLNYQGPDHGTQYRSAVFYANAAQKKAVEQKRKELADKNLFSGPIVTTLEPLEHFYAAEDSHQNFAAVHPFNPYIVLHDAPKVAALKSTYPALYKE